MSENDNKPNNSKDQEGTSLKKTVSVLIAFILIISSYTFAFAEQKGRVISPNIRDIVLFGHYEQDNDISNGKEIIEWIVLDVQEDQALLLSKHGLDKMDYGTRNAGTAWEKSVVRKWLNKNFLNEAFTAEEQKAILMTNVDNSKKQGNSEWKTKGGKNTKDKLFLLSYHEAFEQYFTSDEERLCTPTDYVDPYNYRRTLFFDAVKVEGRATYIWWLRSPGLYQTTVTNVSEEGRWRASSPTPKGTNHQQHMVRPAMWVDLTNDVLLENNENYKAEDHSQGNQ